MFLSAHVSLTSPSYRKIIDKIVIGLHELRIFFVYVHCRRKIGINSSKLGPNFQLLLDSAKVDDFYRMKNLP